MRFGLLVVGAAAIGALSVSAATMLVPQTLRAVTALGGDLRNFNVGINPIGKDYQSVMQQVTSGRPSMTLPQGRTFAVTPIDVDKLGLHRIDEYDIRRVNPSDARKMRVISAYMRNPAGWRGLSPP